MEIINRIPRMVSTGRELRAEGQRIGLVPTRGALHEGHLALMGRARELCDRVIVSILADQEIGTPAVDLARDAELAFTRGVDLIFAPAWRDMLSEGHSTFITVDGLSDKMEGASMAGHFRGITTLV